MRLGRLVAAGFLAGVAAGFAWALFRPRSRGAARVNPVPAVPAINGVEVGR
jgi:hypothetical protein